MATPSLELQVLYKQSLKRFNRTILTAEDVDDFTRVLDEECVDLVVVDASLAARLMSSARLVDRLNKDVAVIALCGEKGEKDSVQIFAPAVVLEKPVPLDLLCQEVERLFKKGIAGITVRAHETGDLKVLQEAVADAAELAVECNTPEKVIELADILETLSRSLKTWAGDSERGRPDSGKDVKTAVLPVAEGTGTDSSVDSAQQRDEVILKRKTVCPVCRSHLTSSSVSKRKLHTVTREADGYIRYREVNPYLYEIWVCPKCLYAAREEDFSAPEQSCELREKITRMRVGRRRMVGDLEFGQERSLKHGVASFLLAASCYRNYKERDYLGDLFLRSSWLCHELEDKQSEKENLQRAVEHYLAAYDNRTKGGETGGKTNLCYIIGEVLRKLGRFDESREYFDLVIKGESGPSGPDILNSARRQRALTVKPVVKTRLRGAVDDLEDEVL